MTFRFNRMELAGSLGDLGVLLPLGLGMIMINHLDPRGLFFGVGLFYCLAGAYFRIPVAVQPMKAIGSYAIALGLAAEQVIAAGLSVGVLLLLIGLSGLMGRVARLVPRTVIRGIQLATGLLLLSEGVRLSFGVSAYQVRQGASEPFLSVQQIAGVPIHYLLGALALLLVLLLLNNRRFPASTIVVCFGLTSGIVLGSAAGKLTPGLYLPHLLPVPLPPPISFSTALLVLVLPQLPMTLGNAVLANSDLARQYFGADAVRSSDRALCISMGLANICGCLLGGMPMCHGAGGLAAHYRFGARTGGSNLIVGSIFIALALFFGDSVVAFAQMIPLSVLGVLLFFAGTELAMSLLDVKSRQDMFVCLAIVGVTLAANLAWGFAIGLVIHHLLRRFDISV